MPRISLKIVAARGLEAKDLNGLADPFVKMYYKGQKHKTSVQKKTLDPKWNEVFVIEYNPGDPLLTVEVWDYDRFKSNEKMGFFNLHLEDVTTTPSQVWHRFTSGAGEVRVITQIISQAAPPQSAQPVQQLQYPPPGYAPQPQYQYQYPPVQYQQAVPQYQQPPPPGQYGVSEQDLELKVAELHAVLPAVPVDQIRNILIEQGGDSEKALNALILLSIQDAAHPSPPASAAAPVPGGQRIDVQIEGGPSFAIFVDNNPAPPPVAQPLPLGYQQAPQFDPNMQNVYQSQGRRKALLIGINYYNTRAELKGCIQDAHRMKALLVNCYGFVDDPTSLVLLSDDNPNPLYQPTRKNILYAMNWLVEGAKPGDSFFFHYSGHGSQQRDKTGIEEDGMDETILPCDFSKAGHIVDDEIARALVIPLPSGSRLTAVMDCCHSGTGMDLPFTWSVRNKKWAEDTNPLFTAGDVQLFSGCEDAQVSVETAQPSCGPGGTGGAMTTAFVGVLSGNPYGETYDTLFQKLHIAMKARNLRQRPQLTASQTFFTERPFNMMDVVPNHNQQLGRQVRKVRKPKSGTGRKVALGAAAGLLGGILLANAFD